MREHARILTACGADVVTVRRPAELAEVDGLVLPGGESTTIVKLARIFELLEPLRQRVKAGLPTYGSCAGMILLADRVDDAGSPLQETIGGIDITVRRNAFGRQVDSFEQDVAVDGVPGPPVHAVFIRAPWVQELGPAATAIGRVQASGRPGDAASTHDDITEAGEPAGRIVAVRQQHLLATSFHPELTGDGRIHEYFVEMVRQST